MIRQPASYIEQMKTIMNVKQNNRQRVPCWSELRAKDVSRELNSEDASNLGLSACGFSIETAYDMVVVYICILY